MVLKVPIRRLPPAQISTSLIVGGLSPNVFIGIMIEKKNILVYFGYDISTTFTDDQ